MTLAICKRSYASIGKRPTRASASVSIHGDIQIGAASRAGLTVPERRGFPRRPEREGVPLRRRL